MYAGDQLERYWNMGHLITTPGWKGATPALSSADFLLAVIAPGTSLDTVPEGPWLSKLAFGVQRKFLYTESENCLIMLSVAIAITVSVLSQPCLEAVIGLGTFSIPSKYSTIDFWRQSDIVFLKKLSVLLLLQLLGVLCDIEGLAYLSVWCHTMIKTSRCWAGCLFYLSWLRINDLDTLFLPLCRWAERLKSYPKFKCSETVTVGFSFCVCKSFKYGGAFKYLSPLPQSEITAWSGICSLICFGRL